MTAFDWQAIRDRLARAGERVELELQAPYERSRELMDERARILARPPAPPTSAGGPELFTFSLDRTRYALEVNHVREVGPLTELTPVPGTPPEVLGVTHHRGSILAVYDLRVLLGAPPRGLSDALSLMLVLGGGECELGLVADAVHGASTLAAGSLLERSEAGLDVCRRLVRGIARDGLVVLDGSALLDAPELYVGRDPR